MTQTPGTKQERPAGIPAGLKSIKTNVGVQRLLGMTLGRTGVLKLARMLRPNAAVILAYHSITMDVLAAHLEAISKVFEIVHMDDLVDGLKSKRPIGRFCSVTFDDGYYDTVPQAVGLAEERRWPMTFYLPTRWVDGGKPYWFTRARDLLKESRPVEIDRFGRGWRLDEERSRGDMLKAVAAKLSRSRASDADEFMDRLEEEAGGPAKMPTHAISWAEVRKASDSVYARFASHGLSHSCPAALSVSELREELAASRSLIETHCKRPVRHFCYPYGDTAAIGTVAPSMVSEIYESGVTLERGCVLPDSDLALLPRVALYPKDSAEVALVKVTAGLLSV